MAKINLFHELQRLEFERKYDPVKLAVYAFLVGLVILGISTGLLYLGYKPSRETVEQLQSQLKRDDAKIKAAESLLKEEPQYEQGLVLLKKRAEEKSSKAMLLAAFKEGMPTNLFVKKLSINRKIEVKKEQGPKDRKGKPTTIVKTFSYNLLSFEATYTEATKPKSLERRDKLVDLFKRSETLRRISKQIEEGTNSVNKLTLANFATTEPVTNEPAVATVTFEVELNQ